MCGYELNKPCSSLHADQQTSKHRLDSQRYGNGTRSDPEGVAHNQKVSGRERLDSRFPSRTSSNFILTGLRAVTIKTGLEKVKREQRNYKRCARARLCVRVCRV